MVCETAISYYTDMEEIGNLLSNAANPVEFMCQVRMLKGNLSFPDMYFLLMAQIFRMGDSWVKNLTASLLYLGL